MVTLGGGGILKLAYFCAESTMWGQPRTTPFQPHPGGWSWKMASFENVFLQHPEGTHSLRAANEKKSISLRKLVPAAPQSDGNQKPFECPAK